MTTRIQPLSPTQIARRASRTGRGPSDQPDFFREFVGTKPGVENPRPLP
jgi:hypothetical protein